MNIEQIMESHVDHEMNRTDPRYHAEVALVRYLFMELGTALDHGHVDEFTQERIFEVLSSRLLNNGDLLRQVAGPLLDHTKGIDP